MAWLRKDPAEDKPRGRAARDAGGRAATAATASAAAQVAAGRAQAAAEASELRQRLERRTQEADPYAAWRTIVEAHNPEVGLLDAPRPTTPPQPESQPDPDPDPSPVPEPQPESQPDPSPVPEPQPEPEPTVEQPVEPEPETASTPGDPLEQPVAEPVADEPIADEDAWAGTDWGAPVELDLDALAVTRTTFERLIELEDRATDPEYDFLAAPRHVAIPDDVLDALAPYDEVQDEGAQDEGAQDERVPVEGIDAELDPELDRELDRESGTEGEPRTAMDLIEAEAEEEPAGTEQEDVVVPLTHSTLDTAALDHAVAELHELLHDALLAAEIWDAETGERVAGDAGRPLVRTLFNLLTGELLQVLPNAGLPTLGGYYLLDLAEDQLAVVQRFGDGALSGCMILDSRRVNLGILTSIAIPELAAAVERARS